MASLELIIHIISGRCNKKNSLVETVFLPDNALLNAAATT